MEAADDIAYCVSDIEDGIEKGLVMGSAFADHMLGKIAKANLFAGHGDKDADDMTRALNLLREPVRAVDGVRQERLTPMQDFRSAVIRYLARHAGEAYRANHAAVLKGKARPILSDGAASPLLSAIKEFAAAALYSSTIVRHREITAQAVLSGLLDAYLPLMCCERQRFDQAVLGHRRDDDGRPIARESSLISRFGKKHFAVYRESVRRSDESDPESVRVMERVHRTRLIVDHISGMTDEFALQSFQLISGMHVNPYRN